MVREDLNNLMAFVVIADEKSFTRAGHRLGVSTSALSHTMRLLEERLGTKLLQRTTRSVAPTAAGEKLLMRLKPALNEIAMGLNVLSENTGKPSGLVRINTHRSAAMLHLMPKLAELSRSHPDVVVDICTEDNIVDIVSAGFDAGVRHGEHLELDMIAVKISEPYRTAIVASPSYLEKRTSVNKPEDLLNQRCLIWRRPSTGTLFRWELERNANKRQVNIEPAFISSDMQVIIAAANEGVGVAYTMYEQVAKDISAGHLVELLPEWSVPREACYLYYPDRRQIRPALRVVIDALRISASPDLPSIAISVGG